MAVRGVLIGLLGVWLAALPFLTARRVAVFRSDLTVGDDAVRANPLMPRARLNLAKAIWEASHNAEETALQLRIAWVLLPEAPLAPHRKQGYTFLVNMNLGTLAGVAGRAAEAQRYYRTAAVADPRMVRFMNGTRTP